MASTVFKARKVVGGKARGPALVSREPVCFLGGVDTKTGLFTEKDHPLEGSNIAGKVLVFPIGKGSTGGAYLLYEMVLNGVAPVAIVNLKAEPITAVGCIVSEVPMVDQPDTDLFEAIQTGDLVEVDADAGVVAVIGQGPDGT